MTAENRPASDVYGWHQEIYNRPARVDAVYPDQAKVRWQDNGTLGFVPLEALK